MSSDKNSQTRNTPLVCFQIGKILKLRALPLFNLKWKEFLNQKHSLCLLSVNTSNSSSTIMHIIWFLLRIQSHNSQSKKARLFTWIQMTLILPNKREWFGYRISCQKTYSKGLPFAHLKMEKIIFLKIDKNTTLQRRFLHHKNLAHFKNFYWINLFWNHHVDLIRGLYHHHGWPRVFQQTLELRLDLIPLKGVRRQSIKDSVPLIWTTVE